MIPTYAFSFRSVLQTIFDPDFSFLNLRPHPASPLFPYTTLFRSVILMLINVVGRGGNVLLNVGPDREGRIPPEHISRLREVDRKSTRLNSSHMSISYAVFCLKKKKDNSRQPA